VKAKPVARQGRKATDLYKTAGLPLKRVARLSFFWGRALGHWGGNPSYILFLGTSRKVVFEHFHFLSIQHKEKKHEKVIGASGSVVFLCGYCRRQLSGKGC
jgi:hypothetical protein